MSFPTSAYYTLKGHPLKYENLQTLLQKQNSDVRKAPKSGKKSRKFKRIVICCDGMYCRSAQVLFIRGVAGSYCPRCSIAKLETNDPGTWQRSDGLDKAPPSNVTRIARSIKSYSKKDKIQQIVYYQRGVGTSGKIDKILGG